MIHEHNSFLVVQVPEGARMFYMSNMLCRLTYFTAIGDLQTVDLPPGYTYECLGKRGEVSEEVAQTLFEKVMCYDEEDLRKAIEAGEDYEDNLEWPAFKDGGEPYADRCQYSATDSLLSYFRANNLQDEWPIVKRIKNI